MLRDVIAAEFLSCPAPQNRTMSGSEGCGSLLKSCPRAAVSPFYEDVVQLGHAPDTVGEPLLHSNRAVSGVI